MSGPPSLGVIWRKLLELQCRLGNVATGGGGGGSSITALTGDVTASGPGSAAATIANDAVTYAQMQNVSAASRLLGRGSASGSGNVEEITLGANLSMSGTSLNAVGGGGGGVISASGFYLDDGSQKYAPVFAVTPPVNGDFAWVNQDSASVDTLGGAVHLLVPVADAGEWHIRKKAIPGSTYTITIAVLLDPMLQSNDQFGFFFRQSSDGKLAGISLQWVSAVSQLSALKYSGVSAGSFGGFYAGPFGPSPHGPLWFFQLSDTGTDRICRYSSDGLHWRVLHSVGRTDYLTADEVGFAINMNTASSAFDYGVTILSWVETA